MIKLTQTKLHDPPRIRGNCFVTVLACFLECAIEDLPEFEDTMHTSYWPMNCFNWLNSNGWEWGSLDGHTTGYYIVCGKSPRSDCSHACIYKDGKLWHDPHPSGGGIETEDTFEYLVELS